MLTILRKWIQISNRFALHRGREVNLRIFVLKKYQPCIIFHSKFHILNCYNMRVSQLFNKYTHAIEEEDGFEMVRVKAPPGAADAATPGNIEWEKTVGSHVAVGEVVCKIRFKEDRTLDITSPVTGVLAVRKKKEGEIVQHGDELFKVRLEISNRLKTKKKKKKTTQRDYFEEEEEFVGKSSYMTLSKYNKAGLKSAYLGSRGSYEQEPKEFVHEVDENNTASEPYHPSILEKEPSSQVVQQTYQTQSDLIPHPYAQTATTPVSQLMTTINEINMEGTLNFVNNFSKSYELRYGDKPTLRSMYIKAAGHALKRNTKLNVKVINDELVEKKEIEITVGIRHLKVLAFHTMKNIDKMSYIDISRVIHDIEKQVSTGTYKSEKGERGFTVTTEWELGSIVGTPSYSKSCTLGLHSIIKRPIFEGNKIVAHPMMYVSLTYDRKVIDDQDAAEYLKFFKMSMEDPRHILVYGD